MDRAFSLKLKPESMFTFHIWAIETHSCLKALNEQSIQSERKLTNNVYSWCQVEIWLNQ